jgi:hypothetical protein
MAQIPDYQKEAYYALKQLAYQRRIALVAIDKFHSDPSLSPEERLDQISKVLEMSGMKTDLPETIG